MTTPELGVTAKRLLQAAKCQAEPDRLWMLDRGCLTADINPSPFLPGSDDDSNFVP